MSKKKKDKLLLNLLDGQKHRHRVAMVTEEGAWNQHEPNSGMARMFVIMLLIHVVVIGGIIIYDFVNGEEAPADTVVNTTPETPSALPPSSVNTEALDKAMPIEEFDTYEWKSGDSLPIVAQKLRVSEEELIKLNLLDKGAQLDQNSILRVPKRPVVRALGLNVAGANGSAPQMAAIVEAPTLAGGQAPELAALDLTVPGEDAASSSAAISGTPADASTPVEEMPQPHSLLGGSVATAPPAAEAATGSSRMAETPADAPPAAAPEVPKAVPVPRPAADRTTTPSKAVVATPAKKTTPAPKAKGASHVVKPGETLYRIAGTYGISVSALQKANNITKPELLRDGMKLVIPGK